MRQIKEIKLNRNSVFAMRDGAFNLLETLCRELPISDYHIVLYLLTFLKEGIDINDVLQATDVETVQNKINLNGARKYPENVVKRWVTLIPIFAPLLQKLTPPTKYRIAKVAEVFKVPAFKEHFPEIFDDVLIHLTKTEGRSGGEHVLPIEITRFVSSLAPLPDNARVYNPFAGWASFGVMLHAGRSYFGQEIDPKTWAIGVLRIFAYEPPGESVYQLGDSIANWNPKSEKYDLIISNPPFGVRLKTQQVGRFGEIKSYEHYLIEKSLEDLSENGKLTVIVPNGFLFRQGSEKRLRRFLVEDDLLEMVISLPGGILSYTGIGMAILLINKSKEKTRKVRVIDAKKYVNDKRLNDYALNSLMASQKESDAATCVSIETIQAHDYNLSPARYLIGHLEVDHKFPLTSLGAFLKPVNGKRVPKGQIGTFVRIRDLSDDKLDYTLKPGSIIPGDIPSPAYEVTESCLLIGARWNALKPTYFEYTGQNILVSLDVYAFNVDKSKIVLSYLINELHADYAVSQVEAFRTGSIVPMIKRQDFLNIRIQAPNEDIQLEIVRKMQETLLEAKSNESRLSKTIRGLEQEMIEQNTYLRHILAGPTSNLQESIKNIKRILIDKLQPSMPHLMEERVSEIHELTLGDYIRIIERDGNKISNAVARQLKVDTGIESKELTPIEIIPMIETFVKEYTDRRNVGFEVDFSFDKEAFLNDDGDLIKTYILGNQELLFDLLNNLIENAVSHAFDKGTRNRVEIFVMKYDQDENQSEIQILFSNTGKPFPKDFGFADFVRKGTTAGSNAGQGFGGWYINEIVKRMNGSFDIIDETGPEGISETDLATSFEINLPIIEAEENEEV